MIIQFVFCKLHFSLLHKPAFHHVDLFKFKAWADFFHSLLLKPVNFPSRQDPNERPHQRYTPSYNKFNELKYI